MDIYVSIISGKLISYSLDKIVYNVGGKFIIASIKGELINRQS